MFMHDDLGERLQITLTVDRRSRHDKTARHRSRRTGQMTLKWLGYEHATTTRM
jgi:hypothetical protein